MFEDDPEQRWRDRRVLDVSSAGAGLAIADTDMDEPVGTRIIVAIHLRGEPRNVGSARDEGLRLGIKFVDLTEEEQAYLESLRELQAAW
jgi:hypothetical protein